MPDLYTHRTRRDSLEAILADGAIRPVRDISEQDPDRPVSVEPTLAPFMRRNVAASEAVGKAWSGSSDRPGQIFLTQNAVVGGKKYGDYVIAKHLSRATPSPYINTIKGEYVTDRPLSVRSNATIYVPDEELEEWTAQYPRIRFSPKSSMDLPEHSPYDVIEFARRLKEHAMSEKTAMTLEEAREILGKNTHYHGSRALGVDHENSDTDYLSVQQSPEEVERMVAKLRGLGYTPLPTRRKKLIDPEENVVVPMRGNNIDVVIAAGPRAQQRVESVYHAGDLLTPERREAIRAKKEALKKSWFLPKTRHRSYVEGLDKELGITPLWARQDGSMDTPERPLSQRDLRRWFGPNARFTGSSALGIEVPGSDVDVFVPYKGEKYYERALERIQEKGLDLHSSPYNARRQGAHVMTGTVEYNGKPLEIDVTFGTGEKAWARQESIERAAAQLSEDKRREIRETKARLKNAWFRPEQRYHNYKKRLDQDLGIIRL